MSEAMSALGEQNLREIHAPPLTLVDAAKPTELANPEVVYVLARGPYVGRLMAQETLLRAAEDMMLPPGMQGPELPYYAYEDIFVARETRAKELEAFDAENAEPNIETAIKKSPSKPAATNTVTLGETALSLVQGDVEPTMAEVDEEETDEALELEGDLELAEAPTAPRTKRDPFNVSFGRKASGPPPKPIVWPPVPNATKEPASVKPPQRFSQVSGLPMPPEDMPLPITELEQRQHVEERRATEAVRVQWAAGWSGPSQRRSRSSIQKEAFSKENGLCEQTDPEAFFPEKGGSTRDAKKVCLECGVRGECLEYALVNDERFGIWGGLSERERRKLKKRAV
jgi:WhiB family redox-sensing transcriptional regulator